jgi:hypothetical protein
MLRWTCALVVAHGHEHRRVFWAGSNRTSGRVSSVQIVVGQLDVDMAAATFTVGRVCNWPHDMSVSTGNIASAESRSKKGVVENRRLNAMSRTGSS